VIDDTPVASTPSPTDALRPEVLDPVAADSPAADGDGSEDGEPEEHVESIEQPAKLLRIGSMVKQLLEEVRQAPLDEASRGRLREITWPGTPTTTELGGTALTTTAFAPIRLSWPIVIGPRIFAPAPIVTRSPTVG